MLSDSNSDGLEMNTPSMLCPAEPRSCAWCDADVKSVAATGPCYTSKVMKDYDLCGRCRQQPQAERHAPFSRRQGRKRDHEDNGPALISWYVSFPNRIDIDSNQS